MTTNNDEARFLALEEARLAAETRQALTQLQTTLTAVPKRVLGSIKAHPAASSGIAAAVVAGVVSVVWALRVRRSRAPTDSHGGRAGQPRVRSSAGVWMGRLTAASQLLSTVAAALAANKAAPRGGARNQPSHS